MPAYDNTIPPLALHPGDLGFSFNAEVFPADETAGSQFCIPENFSFAPSLTVRWQTIFGSTPSAVDMRLQSAMHDVDAEYKDVDRSTSTASEVRTVTGIRSRFLRIKKVASTGGASLTAKILV